MGKNGRSHVVARDDHAEAEFGHAEYLLGKLVGQANAAVRGGISWQRAGMQRNARPRDALHERHRRVIVAIGIVLCLFLQHAEHPCRGFVVITAAGDRGPQNGPVSVVERYFLLSDGDDGEHQLAGSTAASHVIPSLRLRARIGRVGNHVCKKGNQKDEETGAPLSGVSQPHDTKLNFEV